METAAVERSVLIDAPRERVWQAITDPAQLEHNTLSRDCWCEPDLIREGDVFVVVYRQEQ